MNRLFYILIFSLIAVLLLQVQSFGQPKLSSYEGLHFMVGFMENESNTAEPGKEIEQFIFITSEYETRIKVKYGLQSPIEVFIPKNEVVSLLVPRFMENSISEVVSKSLIEVTSEVPITIYAFSSVKHSSDSYSVIPISNWGNEYVVVSVPNDHYNKKTLDSIKDFTPRSSQFLIMAAYDNTTITYYPKSMTRKLNQIDSAYTIVLNKGECYLVQSWQYQRGQGDLTGTYIKSDKPVGVLSGHVRTALLQGFTEQPPDSKDHICEMLMPVASWGRTFISVPFGTNPNKGDYFKAVTRSNNVKFDIFTDLGTTELKFSPNQNWTIFEGLNRPALWVASAPVQLAQFMYRANDSLETIFYDPSMVILPPVEQFISRINFATPGEVFRTADGVKYISHYVTLVAQNIALESLKINNRLVESISNIRNQVIPGTDMHWARLEIPPGQHIIETESGRFSGIIYGVGRFDSYAMVLGSSLENPYSEDKVMPTHKVTERCYELQGTITDEISDKSFGIYYAVVNRNLTNNFNWSIEPILPNSREIKFTAKPIDIYRDGRFVIDYYDKSGNRGTYTKFHNAIKITHPDLIILKGIDWNDSTCFEHYIKNDGLDAIMLTSAMLSSDSRVQLHTIPQLPYEIKGGDSIRIKICINPKGDFNPVLGKIELNFDCDIKYSYNFRGDVMALDLAANGYDFGDVLIGDTICDSISIENRSNIPVEINGIELLRNLPEFHLDSSDIFPIILAPSEILNLEVCFSPGVRSIYQDTVLFINEYDFRVFAVIKGRGVAPEFESVALDWGKRRVGTQNDSTIYIKNSGNTQGTILFKKFTEISTPDFNSNVLEQLNTSIVDENDLFAVNLRYIPEKNQDYKLTALYHSDWRLHPEFTITLSGEPTLPEIRTFDYDFGDVQLYSIKPATFNSVLSDGNEKLTIDSIYIYSGDAGSFNFDLNAFNNYVLNVGNEIKFDIEFAPMRLGQHEIIFAVVHDANPAYERSVSYFKVTANSIAPKVEDFEIKILTNPTFSCLYQLGSIQITNVGDVQTDITGLTAVSDKPDIFVRILNFNPAKLQPGQTVLFDFEYYLERNVTGTVTFKIELFGEYSIERNFEVQLPSSQITINPLTETIYGTGDTVTIKFSGKFNQSTDTLVSFSFLTDLRRDFLYPIEEKVYLNIKNNSIMNNYLLFEKVFFDKLEFIFSERLIKVSENTEWSFEKRFVGLLSPEQERVWNARVSSDECFEPYEIQYKTKLDDLCVFDLRHVHLQPNFKDVNIYPNPVNDLMKLKIVSDTDLNNVNIHITDVFGNNRNVVSDYKFSKGINEYYIKTSDLISGSYMLHFLCNNFEKNIMFVIIK